MTSFLTTQLYSLEFTLDMKEIFILPNVWLQIINSCNCTTASSQEPPTKTFVFLLSMLEERLARTAQRYCLLAAKCFLSKEGMPLLRKLKKRKKSPKKIRKLIAIASSRLSKH